VIHHDGRMRGGRLRQHVIRHMDVHGGNPGEVENVSV
jgi:hypothetical protein